ncbi:MAG: carbon-nitrogen hydrolase family protein [Pseudomonadota bacterium]
MSTFKAAVVQAAPVPFDLSAGVDKTIAFMKEARANGADLIAFSECWLPGYPFFIWLGSPFWSMQFLERYHENCLAVDGAEMARLQEAAANLQIEVVLGYSERSNGTRYMGQCLIESDGTLAFTRRKLKPTHMERTMFGEGDGGDLVVAETRLGRIGALNCWEHIQPLNKYAMYSMHEQVHVSAWPSFCMSEEDVHALGPTVNHAASRVYAVEGQCFVLAPCAVTTEDYIDLVCDSPDKRAILHAGGGVSMIYAPDGRELCESLGPHEEGLIYADIDLSLITYAKATADPVGHYAKPDATRLVFDQRSKPPVQLLQDAEAHASSEESAEDAE